MDLFAAADPLLLALPWWGGYRAGFVFVLLFIECFEPWARHRDRGEGGAIQTGP